MNEVAPVTFTLPQLWMLNSFIRHEFPQIEMWKFPPGGRELNDMIADAIHACETSGRERSDKLSVSEYTLLLSKGDLYAIDYHIRDGMKDANGINVGRQILLLTFEARRTLAEGAQNTAVEPPVDHEALEAKMAEWKEKNHANPGTDPNHDSNDQSE